MVIIEESSIGAFLLTILLQCYPLYYLTLLFYLCTCWVPTISVLNLAIFCYSNLLLRRRRWTGILWRWVLGYVLPRLPFMWSYEVFRCSISLRVVIVFKDIIYIITIFYSWHLDICEHFWPYMWNTWSWVMHLMSIWFWHKNRVWQLVSHGPVVLPSNNLHGPSPPASQIRPTKPPAAKGKSFPLFSISGRKSRVGWAIS
jgi:hypothetical protein